MAAPRHTASPDLHSWVEQHDKELALVRQDVSILNTNMLGLEKKLDGQGSKLDTLISAVAGMQANKPMPVLEAISIALRMLSSIAFLLGATVAAIVYVSSNANNADLAVMKEKISRVETILPWAPTVTPKR